MLLRWSFHCLIQTLLLHFYLDNIKFGHQNTLLSPFSDKFAVSDVKWCNVLYTGSVIFSQYIWTCQHEKESRFSAQWGVSQFPDDLETHGSSPALKHLLIIWGAYLLCTRHSQCSKPKCTLLISSVGVLSRYSKSKSVARQGTEGRGKTYWTALR